MPDNPRDPEFLFDEFLAHLEAGDEVSIEELCSEHAEHADSLRRLWVEYEAIQAALPGGSSSFLGPRPGPRKPPAVMSEVHAGEIIDDYQLIEPLGRGGMGQLWVANQISLDRQVALKFILPERLSEAAIELFSREARAGGRLNHPGIVAVHGHGTTRGRAWISMELVKDAWTLADSLDELRKTEVLPQDYYSQVAQFVAKIADALSTAHEAGVIHRDIKPRNILITPDDSPKITDFGLAKITDETAISATGDFIGTYAYMSPEQAAARRMGIDHRTDLFSLGVVLYEMLALRRPFEGDTPAQITEQILTYDPPDLGKIRSGVPLDLAIICEKTLEKRRDERYASAADLAADLRRHLAHEPILARASGRLRRCRKWVRRHPLKSAVAAALTVLVVVLATAGHLLARAERRERGVVSQNLDERLAAGQVAAIDELWPIHPDEVERMEAWLDLMRELVERLPDYEAKLQELDRECVGEPTEEDPAALRGAPDSFELYSLKNRREAFAGEILGLYDTHLDAALESGNEVEVSRLEKGRAVVEAEIPRLDAVISSMEQGAEAYRTSRFVDSELERRYSRLSALVDGLRRLARPSSGGIAVVENRLASARGLRERSVEAHSPRWAEAIASIQDRAQCPLYDGLIVRAQIGLVPLRRDPASELWEFWHVLSGKEPRVDVESGEYEILAETGMVLVLIPGGSFHMGGGNDPNLHNYCAPNKFFKAVRPSETPVHEVSIDPYLLSKYELTQDQWWRLTETMPSAHQPGFSYAGNPTISRTHPVEHVSWYDCRDMLSRWTLEIPTEAQWERAARAGLETASWTGEDFGQILSQVNFADLTLEGTGFVRSQPVEIRDGYSVHAPVDRFPPNPWGLYSISGNVQEWCRDWHADIYETQVTDPSTGEHVPKAPFAHKAIRGGGFRSPPAELRVSKRFRLLPSFKDADLGVRPARPLIE